MLLIFIFVFVYLFIYLLINLFIYFLYGPQVVLSFIIVNIHSLGSPRLLSNFVYMFLINRIMHC